MKFWLGVCAGLCLVAIAYADGTTATAGGEKEGVADHPGEDGEVAQTESDDGVSVEDVSNDEEPAQDDNSKDEKPWKYDKHGILILTKHNFDAAIDAHDHLFVVFNKPDCGQCIKLNPLFVEAWKGVQEKNTPELFVQFAKIDASNETALLVHYGITQFPTLTFFKNQKEKMYDGGYRAMDIEAWVLKRIGEPARPIFTVEELDKLREENEVIAVGFFNDLESVSALIYRRVADAVHDYRFFFIAEPALFEEYKIIDDTIVVFKKFDDGRSEFAASKDFVADDLMEFLRLETFPLVSELNMENVWRVTEEGHHVKSHFLFFRNSSDPAAPKNPEQLLLSAAKKYKGEFLFLMVDITDRRMYHMEEFFGIRKEQTPAMRIFRYEGPTFKFRPLKEDGPVTEEDVFKFCEDFKKGNLKPFTLEEPLPEDWDANAVKHLTASNYNEVTGDKSRHVFVILHAPWCPQCQLVMPIFEKLAEIYVEHSDVIAFAKMDGTVNEVDGVDLVAYPTFYLYGQGDVERQQYNGTRTIDTMVDFLSEHTNVKLEIGNGDTYPTDADSNSEAPAAAGTEDPASPAEDGGEEEDENSSTDVTASEEGAPSAEEPQAEPETHKESKDEL